MSKRGSTYEAGYNTPGDTSKPEALGQSEAFLDFQERLSRVAKVDRPVLIVGERGTGKELAIARLHYLSSRWQGPLVALNCAALSPSVLESELFGHEAGSFTGASRRREGRFEAAESGTLFLDEIGLIPIEVQEKILRAVEYRQFERVGASEPVQVDVRIIGATNADLPKLAAEGKFKRDLLDRLSFEVLFLPALRDRKEDIMLLARHFAARMATELGRSDIPQFSSAVVRELEHYPWPGNIRELKNVIERGVYKNEGGIIEKVEFDPFVSPYAQSHVEMPGIAERGKEGKPGDDSTPVAARPTVENDSLPAEGINLLDAVKCFELGIIKKALAQARYHQGEAAGMLGVSYHQFRGLYRKYKKELDAAQVEAG